MKREQMEHILRAAAAITLESEFVVLGSQALLATVPQLPDSLGQSMELDLYPVNSPEVADVIDGSIGELSPFHETFGYYAHGVSPETAMLPENWRARLVEVSNENTGHARGLCLSALDLAVAKLLAGRRKDMGFVHEMLKMRIVDRASVTSVVDELLPREKALTLERLNSLGPHT